MSKKGFNVSNSLGKKWRCIFPSDILAKILRYAMMILPIDLRWNNLITNAELTNKINLPIYFCKTSTIDTLECDWNGIFSLPQGTMIQKIWDAICYWDISGHLCFEWPRWHGQTTGLIITAGIILKNSINLKIVFVCPTRYIQNSNCNKFIHLFGQNYSKRIEFVLNNIKALRGISGNLFLIDGDTCNDFKLLKPMGCLKYVKIIHCYRGWDSNVFMPRIQRIREGGIKYTENPKISGNFFQEILSFPPPSQPSYEEAEEKRRKLRRLSIYKTDWTKCLDFNKL